MECAYHIFSKENQQQPTSHPREWESELSSDVAICVVVMWQKTIKIPPSCFFLCFKLPVWLSYKNNKAVFFLSSTFAFWYPRWMFFLLFIHSLGIIVESAYVGTNIDVDAQLKLLVSDCNSLYRYGLCRRWLMLTVYVTYIKSAAAVAVAIKWGNMWMWMKKTLKTINDNDWVCLYGFLRRGVHHQHYIYKTFYVDFFYLPFPSHLMRLLLHLLFLYHAFVYFFS